MKKWNKPDVEVLGVNETKYGSSTVTVSDGPYTDPETGHEYSGWAPSGNTEQGNN